jgi:hypothetical protein
VKARVYVTLRKDVLDPQGEAVRRGLGSLGYDEVTSVRIGNKRKRCQEPFLGADTGPNNRVQATENSLRSCVAPAIFSA